MTETSYELTINGEGVTTERRLDVLNPATAAVFARAPDASRHDLDLAVEAARAAFPKWRATPHADRACMLKEAAGILMKNVDELKRLLTSEQGSRPAHRSLHPVKSQSQDPDPARRCPLSPTP